MALKHHAQYCRLHCLTRTIESISFKAFIACAIIATISVIAGCIGVTVINICTTFINVYIIVRNVSLYTHCYNNYVYGNYRYILVQLIPSPE